MVMPNPSCCIVCIAGVGAVYENPKKFRFLFCFQFASAVRNIPHGRGVDVARWNIVAALFLLFWKVYCIDDLLPCKNVVVIGPQRPSGSIAKGSRIICLSSNSFMTSSPFTMCCNVERCLLQGINFFRSNLCKCWSAKAVRAGIALSEISKEEFCELL